MTQLMAIDLTRTALIMTILIASPMLMISLCVGLCVSIIQTTTSIQEQTLTFVPKLFAMLISIAVFGSWMIRMMTEYVIRLISTLPSLAP